VAALSTASQKLGEKMYADMQAQAAAGGGEAGAAGAGAAGAEAGKQDAPTSNYTPTNTKPYKHAHNTKRKYPK